MILTNFKLAYRNLLKNKVYAVINIVGLMVGIASLLLIYRIVSYEYSFNKDFENYDKIVRVVHYYEKAATDTESMSRCVPIPAMKEIKETVPQLTKVSRIKEVWPTLIRPGKDGAAPLKKFNLSDEQIAFFADQDFLEVFKPTLLSGNFNTALTQPNSVLLNQTMATKLFDNWEQALGQTIRIDDVVPVVVKGVYKDFPINSDFPIETIFDYETLRQNRDMFYLADDDQWGSCSSNDQVFALLESPNQLDAANASLYKVGEKFYTDAAQNDPNGRRVHTIQPISDIHYNEGYGTSGTYQVSEITLDFLSTIGILILLIACFNFINLATSQSATRAKEVGVRKTLGGRPGQLIAQFMSETGLLVLTATIMGIMLAEFALPLLNYVSRVPLDYPFLTDKNVWTVILGTYTIVTILAGLYPSFVLSSYQPVEALSKKVKTKTLGGMNLQKGLVVAQFVVSCALIISTLVVIQQMKYIQEKDMGFSKDLVYTFQINNDSLSQTKLSAFKNAILNTPGVSNISMNSDHPFSGNTWRTNSGLKGAPPKNQFDTSMKYVDENYADTYQLKLLTGRWLDPSDTSKHLVVNETFLKRANIKTPEEAINQEVSLGSKHFPIVGVVQDFHSHNFYKPHEPLAFTQRKEFFWTAAIKIHPKKVESTLASIEGTYDQFYPNQVLEGEFFNDFIYQFYEFERIITALATGFGFIAIFISCLGLLGLAMHASARRNKEIGVRKVLGATISDIIALLSKDFMMLVFIALLIAIPLAWYVSSTWLNDFAYRIDIQWWVFAVAGFFALLIAFVTVGVQGYRAAIDDPIASLRDE